MKNIAKNLLAAACFAASLPVAASLDGDSVLLWMASTQNEVTDNGVTMTVGELVSRGLPSGAQHVNGARVRVYENGTALTSEGKGVFLDLYEQDANGSWILPAAEDRASLLLFDKYGPETPASVGPSWADFGQYASDTYSFAIELGFLTGSGEWFAMATGEIVGYDKLDKYRSTDIVMDPRYVPWASSYVVPEPSCGLLMFVGGALLALRRRRGKTAVL